MASMLEVMREYRHLTAKKRAEGSLPPSLEERLAELEGVVKAVKKNDGDPGDVQPPPPGTQSQANLPAQQTQQAQAKRASAGLPKAKAPTSPGSRPPTAPSAPAQAQAQPRAQSSQQTPP